MIRHGEAPYLECSSKGDKRFSAFYAYIDGWSIEQRYQSAKIFHDGLKALNWKQNKGKQAVNQEEVNKLYSELWDKYIDNHHELMVILKNASGVSDIFGQPGHCCQATELWRIRNRD